MDECMYMYVQRLLELPAERTRYDSHVHIHVCTYTYTCARRALSRGRPSARTLMHMYPYMYAHETVTAVFVLGQTGDSVRCHRMGTVDKLVFVAEVVSHSLIVWPKSPLHISCHICKA